MHAPVWRPLFSLLLMAMCLGIGPGVRPARAQSLADIAKKEEARRKTIPEAAKIYTNKDLNPVPAGPAPPADAKAADAAKDAATKDAKDATDVKDKQSGKDKAYWSGRMTKLQEQIDRDEGYALAIQTRINLLTVDFVNRPDTAQRLLIERDREKSTAELGRLTQAITDSKKAITDLEEEARRAGVPPGWLR